jgi:hypothetical protein
LSLVEREINELINYHGCQTTEPGNKAAVGSCSNGKIQQKEIAVDEVCPVCYDELLASAEVITYCRYSHSTYFYIMFVITTRNAPSQRDMYVRCMW